MCNALKKWQKQDEPDEVIEELPNFKNRYQNNLESMKGSEYAFDYAH